MAAEALTAHPAFRELRVRVRARWLLEAVRRGLLWGLVGAALAVLVGRLSGIDQWPAAAIAWTALSLLASLVLAVVRQPTDWAIAREADALGLAERITSSLYASSARSAVANLLEIEAHTALASLVPTRYPLTQDGRVWRPLLAGMSVLAVLVVLPIPQLGSRPTDAADRQRVREAEQRVQAIELKVPTEAPRPAELNQHTTEELRTLRDALAKSSSSVEAAAAIEQSQQRLARLPSSDDYAARRSLDSAASALASQQDQTLWPLARALQAHDDQAVQQALADLSQRLDTPGGVSDASRSNMQVGLQSAANAVASSQPQLAGALRRTAGAVASGQQSALTDTELQNLLAQDTAAASALGNLQQAMTDLSQLRATTLPANATLVAGSGTPTAYALVNGTPSANGTPAAVPGTGDAASSSDSARGASRQTGGNGSGASAQTGGNGSGASPNGSTKYDPVYAPTHLGGADGPQVQAPSDPTGASGAGVELPNGPLSAGDVRPYDQVYADYAHEARQSAARQQLPPNVQGLVDRYFGAIAPTPDSAGP